ncbi:MAG: Omp28-related outer membrane protein [Saprospiraceae bacterium]
MIRKIFLFVLLALSFTACDEIAPPVTGSMGPVDPGPDVTGQQRQVLIEEFTGVRCVNCPAGSAAVEDLSAVHGAQLVAVSIHAGEFSPPYSDSNHDFRTPEGDQILSYLGEPFGYPTAVVNRRLFDGEFDLQLGQSQWAGFIAEEKAIPPKVKIAIEPAFNNTNRILIVDVTLFVQEDISDPDVRLSIMITESGIQDVQLTPAGKDAGYIHKHVLRGMMTNYDGDRLTETLGTGAEITKPYSMTLPAVWDENHCDVIAFVSLAGESKDVLQAHKVAVVE